MIKNNKTKISEYYHYENLQNKFIKKKNFPRPNSLSNFCTKKFLNQNQISLRESFCNFRKTNKKFSQKFKNYINQYYFSNNRKNEEKSLNSVNRKKLRKVLQKKSSTFRIIKLKNEKKKLMNLKKRKKLKSKSNLKKKTKRGKSAIYNFRNNYYFSDKKNQTNSLIKRNKSNSYINKFENTKKKKMFKIYKSKPNCLKPYIIINNYLINPKTKIFSQKNSTFLKKKTMIKPEKKNFCRNKNYFLKLKEKFKNTKKEKNLKNSTASKQKISKISKIKSLSFEKNKKSYKENFSESLIEKNIEKIEQKSSKNSNKNSNKKKKNEIKIIENIFLKKQKISKRNFFSNLKKKKISLNSKFLSLYKSIYKNNLKNTVETSLLKKQIENNISKNSKIKTNLNFYKILKLIGKGSFGKVYLSVQKLTNRLVAIKCLEKEFLKNSITKKKILLEVNILKKIIGHLNLIKLLEVFENKKYVFCVFEYCQKGDLLNYIKKKKNLKEKKIQNIFFQICKGLNFLHINRILHRDIKLDNILLNDKEICKICDFGVSRFMAKEDVSSEQCGTPAYLAPEIVRGDGYKGFGVDVWSLGVLLFCLLNGRMPFKGDGIKKLNEEILKGEFNFEEGFYEEVENDGSFIEGGQEKLCVNKYGKSNLKNNEIDFENEKEIFLDNNCKSILENKRVSEEDQNFLENENESILMNKNGSILDYENSKKIIEKKLDFLKNFKTNDFKKDLQSKNKKNFSEKLKKKKLVKIKISEQAKDLVKKMLVLDPKKRIKISEILKHNWFENFDKNTDTLLKIEEYENNKNSYLEVENFKIDHFALDRVCSLGFTKEIVIDSVKNGRFDHASACYYTLENDFNN